MNDDGRETAGENGAGAARRGKDRRSTRRTANGRSVGVAARRKERGAPPERTNSLPRGAGNLSGE